MIVPETPWWQPYVPTIIGFLQFLLLAGLTYYVFRSNAVQKIRERQADWYHKVVVDHAISQLRELFAGMQKQLLMAAEAVELLHHEHIEKARTRSKGAISEAKQTIFQLRSEMSFRLSVFDAGLESEFTQELESLENDIVDWFTKQPDRTCYDARESLPGILATRQARLMRILITKEFRTWGLYWPWSKRGILPPE